MIHIFFFAIVSPGFSKTYHFKSGFIPKKAKNAQLQENLEIP
jgi:hypothetical protein